jgi:hypothetical protein
LMLLSNEAPPDCKGGGCRPQILARPNASRKAYHGLI